MISSTPSSRNTMLRSFSLAPVLRISTLQSPIMRVNIASFYMNDLRGFYTIYIVATFLSLWPSLSSFRSAISSVPTKRALYTKFDIPDRFPNNILPWCDHLCIGSRIVLYLPPYRPPIDMCPTLYQHTEVRFGQADFLRIIHAYFLPTFAAFYS